MAVLLARNGEASLPPEVPKVKTQPEACHVTHKFTIIRMAIRQSEPHKSGQKAACKPSEQDD